MGEAKRKEEYREELGERLKRLAADEEAAKAGTPLLPPELQRIARMEPVARQCVFSIDLAKVMVASMANQLAIAGRPDLGAPFAQLAQGLDGFRAQVMQKESGLLIAQPGDVLRPR